VQKKKICILSRKNLYRVTRVVRQAKVLSDAGHEVTIVCLGLPHDELIRSVPKVKFIKINLESWVNKNIGALKRRQNIKQKTKSANKMSFKSRHTSKWLNKIWSILRHLVLGPLLYLPSAFLLKLPEEKISSKYVLFSKLSKIDILYEWLKPFRQLAWSNNFAVKVSKIISEQKFDYCQAHDNYSLLAAKKLSKRDRSRLIYDAVEISEHRIGVKNSIFSSWIERFERWKEKNIIRKAYRVVTIGTGLAKWYEQRLKIKTPILLRNCRLFVPYSSSHSSIRHDCGMQNFEYLVVWFGYSYPEQGLETLVKVVKYLPKTIHIAIIADVLPKWENFHNGLMETIEKDNLSDQFHFIKARAPNELITYVMGADVGIIPRPNKGLNIYYSLPNKLFEMVMARLPIASSRLDDIMKLIKEYQIGLIFDENNPRDIANKIQEILIPDNFQKLKQSVSEAAKILCWEEESKNYLKLIK